MCWVVLRGCSSNQSVTKLAAQCLSLVFKIQVLNTNKAFLLNLFLKRIAYQSNNAEEFKE